MFSEEAAQDSPPITSLSDVDAQLVLPNPDHDPDPNKFSGGIRELKNWQATRRE